MTWPDLGNAPALTLQNPWAAAITWGGKRVENRSWSWRTPGVLLLHAGARLDPAGVKSCRSLGFDPADHDDVRSAIVAVVQVDDICDRSVAGQDCSCGPWAVAGQYHWRLGIVHALSDPVAARGRQGLWRPGPELVAAVTAALADTLLGIELVCTGQRVDDRGNAYGPRCWATWRDKPGTARSMTELRARVAGWRLGPPGPDRHVMCPSCARPTAATTALLNQITRR